VQHIFKAFTSDWHTFRIQQYAAKLYEMIQKLLLLHKQNHISEKL